MIKKLQRKIKRKIKRRVTTAAREYFKSLIISALLHFVPVAVLTTIFYFITWR